MALQVTTAATGVVRDAHYVTPTGASAAVRTLLLEPQRTNLCIRSEEFDTWTEAPAAECTVAANAAVAPDGTTTADLFTGVTTSGLRRRNVTFTGDGTKCVSVFAKAGTATASTIRLFDDSGGGTRHGVTVTWTAGVPSLATALGAGTLYPVQSYGNGWYRLMFSADSVVAANSNQVRITPSSGGAGGTCLFWGAQAEDAVVPSSYIPTAATTVTRNADSLYWALASLVPREMTVYVRSVNVETGVATGTARRVFHIGAANVATDPRFTLATGAGVQTYILTYDDGPTAVSATVTPSPVPVLFDVLEHRAVLSSGWVATLGVSVQGNAEVTTTATASGPAAAFAEARIYLAGTTTTAAANAFTNLAIALGTKTRAEMRSIAGV
jgi:hypothetical protein